MANNLFSMQGRFYTVQRNADNSLNMSTKVWLGNVEEATLEISTDEEKKKESFSGKRGNYGTIVTGTDITLNLTLDEWLPEALALGLFGQQLTISGKNITGETFPKALVAGDIVTLDGNFVSDVVIKDSTATPKQLVEGTDYKISSATSGDIEIINVTGFTQPFKANYKSSDANSIAIFSMAQAPERFLIFDGMDTQNGKKIYMELYRVQFKPTSSFGLINESFGTLPLTATLLIDSVRDLDPALGGYGRIITSEQQIAVNNDNTIN